MQQSPSTITPPPPSPSRKAGKGLLVFAAAVVGTLCVLLAILLATQGAYLKAKIFPQSQEPSATAQPGATDVALTVDDYTRLETYCVQQREIHITHCGHRPPEEDHACRVTEADHHYHDCLTTTTPEEVRLLAEKERLDAELGEDVLPEDEAQELFYAQ